jgi:hypothetical protein
VKRVTQNSDSRHATNWEQLTNDFSPTYLEHMAIVEMAEKDMEAVK